MGLASGGVPYGFNYTTADQQSGLFVQATIYDITAGSPGVQVSQIPLFEMPGSASPGDYAAVFTPVAGKVYNIDSRVYLDSGFTTLDPNRAPAVETIQVVNFSGGSGGGSLVGVYILRGVVISPPILSGVVISPPILRGVVFC